MSEVIYSKKQIEPLIRKYRINPETNTLFQEIIKMFAEQPNYQLWGVKVVFSQVIPFSQLLEIKLWIDGNKTLIKSLTKKNIVSYSSSDDFSKLRLEMDGLNMITFVKNNINQFNTEQRHMLDEEIKPNAFNGLNVHTNAKFKSWYNIFSKFNKLPENRKKKFISLCSAFRDVNAMKEGLERSTKESYQWNKEDMLAFVTNNTPNCKIIFNFGNIVVLEIPSFEESSKLFGGGRTGWCITREANYFRQYVTDYKNPGHKQYFLFNFDKPETDELAHIGFTIEENRGIVNAHSTKNHSLIGSGMKYHKENVNIYKALRDFGINMGLFLSLNKSAIFEKWDLETFLKFAKDNEPLLSIVYQKNGRVIVKALHNKEVEMLTQHTFIQYRNFNVTSNSQVFIMLDFNLAFNDSKSVVLMGFEKDAYGIDSMNRMFDTYGIDLIGTNYLNEISIGVDDFINRNSIEPTILLHKLIDEGNEKAAIKLIDEQDDKFIVNFTFNDRVPIFSAINHNMFELFKVIISHKNFDSSCEDGFGETLFSSLLYAYGSNEISQSKEDEAKIEKMIKYILDCETFDFNSQDINLDTAINIAVEKPKMLWIVKALLKKPNVDINVINDFNRSALGNAIARQNIEAIRLLGERPDLVIRKADIALAKEKGIKLDEIISIKSKSVTTVKRIINKASNNADFQSIFSEVFAKSAE